MKAISFRVRNFRNVDDSGNIPLERVTNFVGRNESGKTTLLKALHKFNPATEEPYDPQREFPRDRFTKEYVAQGSDGGRWPVCSVTFEIPKSVADQIAKVLAAGQKVPKTATLTRYYSNSFSYDYDPPLSEVKLDPSKVVAALISYASAARRLAAPAPEQEEATAATREKFAKWATGHIEKFKQETDLHGNAGHILLDTLLKECEKNSNPQMAEHVEKIQEVASPMRDAAKRSVVDEVNEIIDDALPVFIYFENYGILDSAIWLPRYLDDYNKDKSAPKVRTIAAMFAHVGLDAKKLAELGFSQSEKARIIGQAVNAETVEADKKKKEERTILLNSASLDISKRFSEWWHQRRYKINYEADGDFFRIWISDDRRPDVKIELESRSKGFQWFFSFYLLFLVESEDGHKDAILLLDEPGLHLHPTAQQELIGFFEKLSEKNQILYSTHSPFLVDGEHLHRVRPVTEDASGHSHVSIDGWPKDRDTIFPLQAAAGYAMVTGLFKSHRNVLLEGMSDYYYLHALSHQCKLKGMSFLSERSNLVACGGTKHMGPIASLFLAEGVRPLVLLDSDEAGRVRKDALTKQLYAGHNGSVLLLDEILQTPGQEIEVEDIIGEETILPALNKILGKPLKLNDGDRKKGSLVSAIESAAERQKIELPDGWKPLVAIELVAEWAEKRTLLSDEILKKASALFKAIDDRFDSMKETQ